MSIFEDYAESFAQRMFDIRLNYSEDPEVCHKRMDDCMVDMLDQLGFDEGTAIFRDSPKWYA